MKKTITIKKQEVKEVEIELPLFSKKEQKYVMLIDENKGVSVYLGIDYVNINKNSSFVQQEAIEGEVITPEEFFKAQQDAIDRVTAMNWEAFREKEVSDAQR